GSLAWLLLTEQWGFSLPFCQSLARDAATSHKAPGVALDEPQNGRGGRPVGPAQSKHNSAMALAGHNNQLAGNLLLSQGLVEKLGLALQRGGIAFRVENDKGRSAGPRAGDWRSLAFPRVGGI